MSTWRFGAKSSSTSIGAWGGGLAPGAQLDQQLDIVKRAGIALQNKQAKVSRIASGYAKINPKLN